MNSLLQIGKPRPSRGLTSPRLLDLVCLTSNEELEVWESEYDSQYIFMFYYLLGSLRNGSIKGLLICELLEDKDRLLDCPPSMLKISDEDNDADDSDD